MAILYPIVDARLKSKSINIREMIYGELRGQVVLRPVELLRLERLITAAGIQTERERGKFAQQMAFGVSAV